MLTQENSSYSTQAVTPERNVFLTSVFLNDYITCSAKQTDNEVETCIIHLMQMYMFVIEVLQKSKYVYPSGQPFPDTPLGCLRHLPFFFYKCTTAL